VKSTDSQTRLFDFGPEPERPAGAPVAALPPWMITPGGAEPPVVVVEPAAVLEPPEIPAPPVVPRARRHAGPPAEAAAPPAAEPPAPAAANPRPRHEPIQNPPPPAGPRPRGAQSWQLAGRLRPGRRTVSGLGIVAMLGGGIGAAALGYGASHGAPSAVPASGSQLVAAEWVAANLGPKASLLAPRNVGRALAATHFDTSRVLSYGDGLSQTAAIPDWHCCNVLLATAESGQAIRDALPAPLRAAYDQSRPIAQFSAGGTTTELRQVLDGTPQRVAASVRAEHAELVAAGSEILAAKRITLSPTARQQAASGDVDARVLVALVGIASRHQVSVADFPLDDATRAADATARAVRIDGLDSKPITAGGAELADTTNFLSAQVAPYRPMALTPVGADSGSGKLSIVVSFDAPGPLGLLAPKR